MQVVIAGNHDLSFDAKASAVGTPYRHIIEHPELEKVDSIDADTDQERGNKNCC